MASGNTLKVTTPSDREIALIRVFNAPRNLVFEALTKPELVKRWLGVFGGWTLDVCEIDLKVGGTYRYVWRHAEGKEMGMGGVYREIVPGQRIVQTERFDQSWYEGDAVETVQLEEKDGKTTMTTRVVYASKEVRDGVLKSPMEKGIAAGYDALDQVLASTTAPPRAASA
jgi:uncharacterized protein YndB with AHSA1/START domain